MNGKYLLFAGESFYPAGGWEDFKGSFNSIEEAKKCAENKDDNNDWAHIVYNNEMILSGGDVGNKFYTGSAKLKWDEVEKLTGEA